MYHDGAHKSTKKLGPKAYTNSQIIKAVGQGKSIDDIMDLSSSLAPDETAEKKHAIVKYKATSDRLDNISIYKAQNGQLAGT